MKSFRQSRILIVEDDWFQAFDLASYFSELGLSVLGPAPDIDAGMPLVAKTDIAVLDININGKLVFPLADKLRTRHVPFVFYSAHSEIRIPERFRFSSRLQKPASIEAVEHTVRAAWSSIDQTDVVRLLPKLRLSARLMLNDPEAADRLVELALRRAIETGQPEDEDVRSWLNRLVIEIGEERGKRLLT